MIRTAGVSIAIPAADIVTNSREDVKSFMRDVVAKLEVELRRHIGEVQPVAAPTFSLDGPHSDPLQGPIYVATYAAPVETDDLPADCTAYTSLGADR